MKLVRDVCARGWMNFVFIVCLHQLPVYIKCKYNFNNIINEDSFIVRKACTWHNANLINMYNTA
jgi:hypothetical protein